MSQSQPSLATLLVHDGELADVRSLLGELGAPFVERRGSLLPDDRDVPWTLVIATPKRLLDLHLNPSAKKRTQIAIVDQDSRTLRNSLHRAGIGLMVRRPVHPAALRALVLHSLYSGPEKRRTVRVSVGAPVRFRVGWRQRPAVLADLSLGGCRLLVDEPVEPDRKIRLQVPAEIAGGRGFSVRARVLRNLPGEADSSVTLTASFVHPAARTTARLKQAIVAFRGGPARMATEPSPADPSAPAPAEPEVRAHEPATDRRAGDRAALDARVIALGDQATRVLMGREISVGGMRVDPSPLLRPGENLRLAIHVAELDVPLVVRARVHRDDGERGVVLRFHELEPDVMRCLNGLVDTLPPLDVGSAGETTPIVVSEILDVEPSRAEMA